MRILQINATYGTGSTGNIVKAIGCLAEECGNEVYYACADIPLRERGINFYMIGSSLDHKIHALYSRFAGSQGLASRSATKRLISWIEEIKPDVIHLHNLHNNYVNYPMLFSSIMNARIPTVITLHDCWFFTGKCCHFVYDGCEKWKEKCGKCPRRMKEIPSFFFDWSTRDLLKKERLIGHNPYVNVIGCSNWITNMCMQSILSDRVIGTIYNGIDTNVFYPRMTQKREELRLENRFIILGMAVKWLSEDNKDTFHAFIGSLQTDETLLLVGCSASQLNQLPNQVIGVPFIYSREDLANYYSTADVFINVTKADTLPTVNIESLACGTPVITYDSGGCSEIVNNEVGAVVPYGDYNQLIKHKEAIHNRGKESYAENCINRVKECFEIKKNFLSYLDLYASLIEEVE